MIRSLTQAPTTSATLPSSLPLTQVLILEDNPSIAFTVCHLLKQQNYRVEFCDVCELDHWMNAVVERPEAFLCPEHKVLDGLELVRTVRRQKSMGRSFKVIVVDQKGGTRNLLNSAFKFVA